MYVDDDMVFAVEVLVALFFTVLSFDFPMTTRAANHRKIQAPAYGVSSDQTQQGAPPGAPGEGVAENRVTPGMLGMYLRAFAFPFLAAGAWFFMALFAGSLNNCTSAFACYTSPTYSTVTATVQAMSFYFPLEVLFYGLGFFMVAVGILYVVGLTFTGLIVEMAEGQRA